MEPIPLPADSDFGELEPLPPFDDMTSNPFGDSGSSEEGPLSLDDLL